MTDKPIVSIICPAFNEEAIIEECLSLLYEYLNNTISSIYKWELIVINDGSEDNTGALIDRFANEHAHVRGIHHFVNMNLGNAIKTGFANASGKYIIIYDLDLSYAPDHIKLLLDNIIERKADIVIASPYMKGGKTTGVPFNRKLMSRWANKYLSLTSRQKLYTFSGMVRAYRADFVKNLSLKSSTFEINTEIIFKAQILRARIIEIPAHLDWTFQNKYRNNRFSGIRIKSGVFNGMVSGFIFRPYMFFMVPGVILLLLSVYIIIWILINTYNIYPEINIDPRFLDDKFSHAIARVFQERPHAFFVGGFALVVALQFLGIGFLSLQNKRYFDEMFYLNSYFKTHVNEPKNY